jgi:hypothetical protein
LLVFGRWHGSHQDVGVQRHQGQFLLESHGKPTE